MTGSDVQDVYAQAEAGDVADLYAEWALRYDAENAAKGFRLPALAAGMMARHLPLGAGPILDAGAGTGQVGACLKILGYDRITGLDLSAEMLEGARRTGAYDALIQADLGQPIDLPDRSFAAVSCVGSFGPGHAPPEALRNLVRVAAPGAPIVFNVVEATWQAQGFPAVMDTLVAEGLWSPVEAGAPFRPYSLGEPDLYCRAFVFRRA